MATGLCTAFLEVRAARPSPHRSAGTRVPSRRVPSRSARAPAFAFTASTGPSARPLTPPEVSREAKSGLPAARTNQPPLGACHSTPARTRGSRTPHAA